jgi:protein-L-isoaspartate(D-aspartate) O-methyltransferase
MRSLPTIVATAGVVLHVVTAAAVAQTQDRWQAVCSQMVQTEIVDRGIRDPAVVRAMREVPRHRFVPANQRKYAYYDMALPIGHGQTITSPYVVAFMTEKLEPKPGDRVLEIGTGSGYQAAVLSRIVESVFSIEIVEPLGRQAARTLEQIGYENVQTKIGDGYQGWPEHAPFDKIIVTCSPEDVPTALVEQLKEGGRLVIPLGERYQQMLYLYRKVDGELRRERLESTFFVPMTGRAEAERDKVEDPFNPQIINGSFEQVLDDGELPGWYYLLQAKCLADSDAVAGTKILFLENQTPGRNAHALQAIGLDGRAVREVELKAHVQARLHQTTPDQRLWPRVELMFYDEDRAPIRAVVLGPWSRQAEWTEVRERIKVPRRARLAVLACGIFGAAAELAIDDLQLSVIR